ncbi:MULTISPECIES: bestrophin family protein [Pseudomonas]|uniref:Bestrophin n=1 Tax=Pseudomonas flexibilis TaxID=706570 RepID=A0A0B3BWJ3_9PSED|nr:MULTISPECIES: bestrophin family ion channel [Pseudomonas]KHO65054.1 bestrophin [Pseudomonas flexibilis]SCY39735.1 putative membrane protein [Pseudomonas flexibilis]
MIVRPRPGALQLFFILRGSILPKIAAKILFISLLACVTVWFYEHGDLESLRSLSAPAFSLLGVALSVFLGFRNSTCYDRWWEARKLWGELVIQSRGLARDTQALLGDEAHAALRERTLRRCIAFAHALAASLRGQDPLTPIRHWIDPREAELLKAHHQIPDALLNRIADDLADCLRRGVLSDVLYQTLARRLDGMSSAQASCERIKSTPTPFAYSLLLHRTAWLFCLLLPFGLVSSLELMTPLVVAIIAYTFFGLDALGDELEDPFGFADNDLPLDALVRVIERDVLDVLGEPVPEALQPKGYVLN